MQNIRRREVALAVSLAASAGFLDAVGFIELGGYFVSFMSGNTTTMAARFAEHRWAAFGTAAGLLGCFYFGVVVGAVVARATGKPSVVIGASAVLVAVAAVLAGVSPSHAGVLIGLPIAMGIINSTFLSSGESSIGLTYVTGALVKSGQRLVDAFYGGPRTVWLRHIGMWFALVVGGALGAVTHDALGATTAIALIAALLGVLCLTASLTRRSTDAIG